MQFAVRMEKQFEDKANCEVANLLTLVTLVLDAGFFGAG